MTAEYFVFECAACGHATTVNDAMRREINEQGCLMCGENAEPSDFSSAS